MGWAPTPLGHSHSETTQTTELTDASIDGESKRRATFPQTKSIIFALERPKAANSVRECEARVPAGVHAPHGRPLSVMILIIEGVAVPTSGWMIHSSGAHCPGFNMCRVFFGETEDSSQCQKNRHSCSWCTTVDYPAFTEVFRDDTDNLSGGCLYSWYLDCKYSADVAKIRKARLLGWNTKKE